MKPNHVYSVTLGITKVGLFDFLKIDVIHNLFHAWRLYDVH